MWCAREDNKFDIFKNKSIFFKSETHWHSSSFYPPEQSNSVKYDYNKIRQIC